MSRSIVKMWSFAVCFFLFGCFLSGGYCNGPSLGCRDNRGNPVDWFFVYKLPKLSQSSNELVRNGVGQAYMDVNDQKWTLLGQGINQTDHAIYNTLQQIYKYASAENIAYLMYNDELPGHIISLNHGHTKGDIAFDRTSGFWLVHSVPKFPPRREDGYDYPTTGMVFGQSFLCITLDYKYFNDIGQQLQYNYPKIYDYKMPSAFEKEIPAMVAALKGAHVTSPPWNKTVELTTSRGTKFISFAKYSSFGKDLYHDWVAPYFSSDLLVETWQNGLGKMGSNCSGYKVYNVQSLSILHEDFPEHCDHSKWAVAAASGDDSRSASLKWICVGDINRMDTQRKRAGGTVCARLENVWNNYKSLITTKEPCHQDKPPSVHSVRL